MSERKFIVRSTPETRNIVFRWLESLKPSLDMPHVIRATREVGDIRVSWNEDLSGLRDRSGRKEVTNGASPDNHDPGDEDRS